MPENIHQVEVAYNRSLRPLSGPRLLTPGEIAEIHNFHSLLPGYSPTPLYDLEGLSHILGIGKLLVKDESTRFGLKSFKSLGCSWAVENIINNSDSKPIFATATDGNHGKS